MMVKELPLKIYTDGGARGNPGPAASAFVVIDQDKVVHQQSKYLGVKTNNQAEYQALLMALSWFSKNQGKFVARRVKFFLDSELVVKQMRGVYKLKNPGLRRLAVLIKSLERKIENQLEFVFIKREENKMADRLVNWAIDENA